MVLDLPKRIPFPAAMTFGTLLAVTLLAEGNPITACFTVLALVLLGAAGFNIADGFHQPAGSYIFFTVLFTGLLGAIVKAVTGELLLNNVPSADETLLIYLVGTCGTVVAAYLSRRIAPAKPFLAGRLTQANTSRAVVGCVIIGIALPLMLGLLGPGFASIARQLNITLPLAVLIGVYQRTRATGGSSSFSWPVFIAWGYSTWIGMLSYSKELMFTPSLAWLIAAAAARLRVSVLQIIIAVPTALLAILILVPYSQYGRNFRDATAADPHVAYNMLRHPLELRAKVIAAEEALPEIYHWFDKPRGILDRLTVVPIDSALIRRTDELGPIGTKNLGIYLENIAPHFILPDKPNIHSGNDYAHEIGMLAPDDHTTGISFSPFADAYHQAGWFGVLVLMPVVQFGMFYMLNRITGGIEQSPWSLFFIMAFGHLAAEGMLQIPIYIASFGMEAIVATAFLMIYITPILGGIVSSTVRGGTLPQQPASGPRSIPPRRPIAAPHSDEVIA